MGRSYSRKAGRQYARRRTVRVTRVIPIERGKLSKFGYSTKKSDRARHAALNRAVEKYGALSVYRMLNAQVILRKRTQPKARRIFEEDREWIAEQYRVDGFAS